MAQRPITKRRVKNAMEKAVREKGPDYVYPGAGEQCLYFEWEDEKPVAPSCLVGHALIYLGIPKKALAEYEHANVTGLAPLLDEYGVPEEVRTALQEAQEAQDRGQPWGDALTAFNNWLDGKEN